MCENCFLKSSASLKIDVFYVFHEVEESRNKVVFSEESFVKLGFGSKVLNILKGYGFWCIHFFALSFFMILNGCPDIWRRIEFWVCFFVVRWNTKRVFIIFVFPCRWVA